MSTQAFTRNYTDHSSDTGFQFEFFCDKCGNGHRSAFVTNKAGFAAAALKAAGALFGGEVAQAGWGAGYLKDALRGPAWDAAFKAAIDECKPQFRQCTRCGHWVCPEVCFNHARGLCGACAPDIGQEVVAIQAQVAVEQAHEQARKGDQLRGVDAQEQFATVGPSCTGCQATLAVGAHFCAQCGTPVPQKAVAAGPKFCAQCGGGLATGARFCAGCGAKVGD
jgi:hypothetical protein